MRKRLLKSRRGDIMVVLVFSVVMAILMLGMLKVAMTLYASGRANERQYADIQTMRAINETACYAYIQDLRSCHGIKNVDAEMPGSTESVIYHESLEAMQKALCETTTPQVWKVHDASMAISVAGFNNPTTQADLLELVMGKAHSFTLRLEEDLDFDFEDMSESTIDTDEARLKLKPVRIEASLNVKTETVVNRFSVEGLYLYVKTTEVPNDSGTGTHTQADIMITDDGAGSGVHIYRED